MLAVWFNGIKYSNIMVLSRAIGVSNNTLRAAIRDGEFRGKPISYYPPRNAEIKKAPHIKGEPLIPYPVTSQISSDYRG